MADKIITLEALEHFRQEFKKELEPVGFYAENSVPFIYNINNGSHAVPLRFFDYKIWDSANIFDTQNSSILIPSSGIYELDITIFSGTGTDSNNAFSLGVEIGGERPRRINFASSNTCLSNAVSLGGTAQLLLQEGTSLSLSIFARIPGKLYALNKGNWRLGILKIKDI